MYYALIMLAILLFGLAFAIKDVHLRQRGGGMKISLEFMFVGAVSGLAVLLPINNFSLQFTWFSLLMATLVMVNNLVFSFCSFRALGTINLSMYSLFSMLGGMLLPFLYGVLFFHEAVTVSKAICLVFVGAAMLLTIKRDEAHRRGRIYYALVFLLNGASGVMAKTFQAAPVEWKTMPSGEVVSAAGYTVLTALTTFVLTGILLLTLFRGKPYETPQTKRGVILGVTVAFASGAINLVGNWFSQIALDFVETSVQSPMVTGGVLIVTTIICFFTKSKPNAREVTSILLAFVGLAVLLIIPTFFPAWDAAIFQI